MSKPASIIKRGAAAVVMAGLLATALPATAMAVSVTDSTNGLSKNWTVEDAAQFKNGQVFSFTVELTEIDNKGVSGVPGVKVGDKTTATVSQDWATAAGDNLTSSKTISRSELFNGWNFTLPGTYTFDIFENTLTGENANANVTIDTEHFTAKVNVVWDTNEDGSLKLNDDGNPTAVIASAGVLQNGKKGVATFNNTPADNSNVTVTKQVKGKFGDVNKDFNYTLKLTGNFTGSYQVKKGNNLLTSTAEDGTATFTLKNGESVMIENLPAGVTYTITENDEANYDEANTVNGESSQNGLIATGTVDKTDDSVVFTNTSNGAVDTGVVLSTIPYIAAGGAAVAGAVTLVISRKRRAHEDF